MALLKMPLKLIVLVLAAIAAGVLWQQTQLTVLTLSRIDPVPDTHALSRRSAMPMRRRMARVADTFCDEKATLYRIGGNSFLGVAQRTGELGVDTVKLAGTFGQTGLRALDKVGALRFVKYTARTGKMAYKGDIIQLLAGLLVLIPQWVPGRAGCAWRAHLGALANA